MDDQIEYKGQTYNRRNGMWFDKNYMRVAHLEQTLNKLYVQKNPIGDKTPEELIREGDSYKKSAYYHLAIKYYEEALKKPTLENCQYVLPRITSCYRRQGLSKRAIDLFERAQEVFGRDIHTAPLFTSVAAACCDIQDYEKAKKYANKAFSINGWASAELKAVYGRIRKETNSDRDDAFT